MKTYKGQMIVMGTDPAKKNSAVDMWKRAASKPRCPRTGRFIKNPYKVVWKHISYSEAPIKWRGEMPR